MALSFMRGVFKIKGAGGKGDRTDPARRHGWESVVPERRADHLCSTQKSEHSALARKHHEPLQPESEQQPLPNCVCRGQPEIPPQELRQGEGCTSEMDGPWEECHVHGAIWLAEAMKHFVIQNGYLTTAEGKAFKMKPGAKPNSIVLGDGMIEMMSDALLQLKTKDGGLAYLHRANLPPQDALRKLQGCWIHRDRYLGKKRTVTIAGSMWTVGGGKPSQGILRMRDGAVVLRDLKVELRSSGKMSLISPSGRVRKFTHSV